MAGEMALWIVLDNLGTCQVDMDDVPSRHEVILRMSGVNREMRRRVMTYSRLRGAGAQQSIKDCAHHGDAAGIVLAWRAGRECVLDVDFALVCASTHLHHKCVALLLDGMCADVHNHHDRAVSWCMRSMFGWSEYNVKPSAEAMSNAQRTMGHLLRHGGDVTKKIACSYSTDEAVRKAMKVFGISPVLFGHPVV